MDSYYVAAQQHQQPLKPQLLLRRTRLQYSINHTVHPYRTNSLCVLPAKEIWGETYARWHCGHCAAVLNMHNETWSRQGYRQVAPNILLDDAWRLQLNVNVRGGGGLNGLTWKSFTKTYPKRLVLHERRGSQGVLFNVLWCVHRSRYTTVVAHANTTIRWPSRSFLWFEYFSAT